MAIGGQFDIPEDILICILSCLPVKSLMRFKCVRKSWCSLFENPGFIAKHLDNDNDKFVFVQRIDLAARKPVFSLLSTDTLTIADANLDFPYLKDRKRLAQYDLVGCCNGILCIRDTLDTATVLWNPATREIKIIPISNLPPFNEDARYKRVRFDSKTNNFNTFNLRTYYMGFCFDSKTNDYKVFNIRDFGRSSKQQIEVYHLSTDSWRKCDALMPFDFLLYPTRVNAYLNGVIFYIAVHNSVQMIVSFDISQEVFTVTPVPDVCAVRFNKNYWRNLTVLNEEESIALILSLNPNRNIYDDYEIWMLKEYGVKESWTKLYTFQLSMCPLKYWKNGHYFMETPTKKLVLRNPVTQEIDDLQIDYPWGPIFFYKESLISLNGFSFSEYSRVPHKVPPGLEYGSDEDDDIYTYFTNKVQQNVRSSTLLS